ncbi:MAG: NAD-dependent epimerase/dehydratase family protein [Propionibacteriaceae bacterium]|jgi:UDP-glucose 4-epimerase|nr:NAD-dependent epimerase/dehydratase family protein [Propionibacteriaceae bacterium]
MRILVTGASGFVGRQLVPALAGGHEVVACVRRPGSSVGAVRELVVAGIDGRTDWGDGLSGVEVVVHLAGRAHVMREDAADPLSLYREVNVEGTRTLAEAAARCGARRLVFMSTIKVNGEGTRGRAFTDRDAPAPVDPYGVSKWEGEQALAEVSARTGLEVVALRPPVMYGPGVKGNIKRIAALVGRGVPLPLGSVANRRTMLSAGNMVRWVRAAVESPLAPRRPVLMGDPRPVSTAELVRQLAAGMGRPDRLVPFPVAGLLLGGKLLRHEADVARLVEDLEIATSDDLRPADLADPGGELRALGAWLAEQAHHPAPEPSPAASEG